MDGFTKDDEKLKKSRLLCLSHFNDRHLERVASHYRAMLAHGVTHFIYYEPGRMFLGWFTYPREGVSTFNVKFCDKANTPELIEQALIDFYGLHKVRRALLINDFDQLVVTDPDREKVVSPLEKVLHDPDSLLRISINTAEMDRRTYQVLTFSDDLEERVLNPDTN